MFKDPKFGMVIILQDFKGVAVINQKLNKLISSVL